MYSILLQVATLVNTFFVYTNHTKSQKEDYMYEYLQEVMGLQLALALPVYKVEQKFFQMLTNHPNTEFQHREKKNYTFLQVSLEQQV